MSNFATTGGRLRLFLGVSFGVFLAPGDERTLVRLRRFSFEVRCSFSIEGAKESPLEVALVWFQLFAASIAEAKGFGSQ